MSKQTSIAFKGTLVGLEFWTRKIIRLISASNKEQICDIIKHIETSDIVEYIIQKYPDGLDGDLNPCTYDIGFINKSVCSNLFLSDSDIKGSFGLCNDDDGLLLILALVSCELGKLSRTQEIAK